MPKLELPPALQGIFFDRVWDRAKVWALPTMPEPMAFSDLAWHLDLPVWSTIIGQARFDLTPAVVLAQPQRYAEHWRRVQSADLRYPLDLFCNGGRWVILDGYHRLARCAIDSAQFVRVRRHADRCWAEIIV